MKPSLLLLSTLATISTLAQHVTVVSAFLEVPFTIQPRASSVVLHAAKKRPKKPTEAQQPQPLHQTLGGGSEMIFSMARRMLLWGEDKPKSPPRWRPLRGVSDVNPNFRTESPIMNNRGYAGAIWRNVRKRNKPALWQYALRTYDRMSQEEAAQQNQDGARPAIRVRRSNVHHEGALLACAKLGLWERALEIYHHVEDVSASRGKSSVGVTDNMVLSVIRACVRAAKKHDRQSTTMEERRAPLDAAMEIVKTIEEKHNLPLTARYLNPLASAYQTIGLLDYASEILKLHLGDRTSGPELEFGNDPLNINDIKAKDKASYSLLVKSAVERGDWKHAVDALRDMTEAGLYPNRRNLNTWTEVAERRTKQRTSRSWKKKRNELWLENIGH